MVRVVNVQRQQLEHRRAEILANHGVTLAEFAEGYALVGNEWDAWEELRGTAFLLADA